MAGDLIQTIAGAAVTVRAAVAVLVLCDAVADVVARLGAQLPELPFRGN